MTFMEKYLLKEEIRSWHTEFINAAEFIFCTLVNVGIKDYGLSEDCCVLCNPESDICIEALAEVYNVDADIIRNSFIDVASNKEYIKK